MKTGRIGYIDARRIAGFTLPANATPGDGQVVDITDPSLGATPSIVGQMMKFRPTGDKVGNVYVTGRQIELYPQGNCGWLAAHGIYVAMPVGTPIMHTLWGQDIYMERLGAGNAIGEYCGVSIGMDNTNTPISRAAFLRCYSHGSNPMQDFAYLPAALGITNLFRFEHQVIPLIAAAVGGSQPLKIRVDVGGVPYYLPLHTA